MKTHGKTIAPRNPYVVLVRRRKQGEHNVKIILQKTFKKDSKKLYSY